MTADRHGSMSALDLISLMRRFAQLGLIAGQVRKIGGPGQPANCADAASGRSLTRPPIRRRWWSADFRSGAFSGVFKTGRGGGRAFGGRCRGAPVPGCEGVQLDTAPQTERD